MKAHLGALMLMIACWSSANADDQAVTRWAWTCGSKAYYGINVFPNGTYKPFGEQHPSTLDITVKRMEEKWAFADACPKRLDYVEILAKGDPGDLFATGENNPCYQILTFRYGPMLSFEKPRELEEMRASISLERGIGLSLDVARDDVEWRFVVSRTDLTTARRSRELRITSPNFDFTPEAGVSMYAGECVLNQVPAP